MTSSEPTTQPTDQPSTRLAEPAGADVVLRAGLADYDLSDEDLSLLDREDDDGDGDGPIAPLPVLAVVGRPNVGKSTMVNRVLGRREAVVQDVPGVTRDRVMYESSWAGRSFMVVDTGGWEIDVRGLDQLFPIGFDAFVAPIIGERLGLFRIARADGFQHRTMFNREEIVQPLVCIRVRAAHEAVANHPYTKFF